MTRNKFLQEYAAKQVAGGASTGDASRMAQDALGEIERGYGSQMGSGAMRVAAFRALAASNKGYDRGSAEANYSAAFNDAGSLVNDGLLNVSDAAAILKSNQARSDFGGIGFGMAMKKISSTAAAQKSGAAGPTFTATDTRDVANDVLKGSNPGAIIQGRHESVAALAPYMVQNLTDTITAPGATRESVMRSTAEIAGLYDEMARTSPLKAQIMADNVLSAGVRDNKIGATVEVRGANGSSTSEVSQESLGQMVTVRELVERARKYAPDKDTGSQPFLEHRREYGAQLASGRNAPPPPTNNTDVTT
jgi:hypothetical protein